MKKLCNWLRAVCEIKTSVRVTAILIFSLLTSSVFVTGCYEGWRAPNADGPGDGAGDGDGDGKPGPGPDPQKVAQFVLLEVFQLSPEAMRTPGCFDDSPSVIEYRINEWQERTVALQAAVAALSEKSKLLVTMIPPMDCRRLNTFLERARDPMFPYVPEISQRGKRNDGKPIIHLKVVHWSFEPNIVPPSNVLREDWDGIRLMKMNWPEARFGSLHYFVVAHSGGGYFERWLAYLASPVQLKGYVIDNPDPSRDGLAARRQVIDSSTRAFADWFVQQAIKL